MRITIVAIALGLATCAPTQPSDSGYKDASFTQVNELNCREQASAAGWRLMKAVTLVLLVIGACVAGAFLALFFDHPTPSAVALA